MFEADALVLVHLVEPREKFWGVLLALDERGIALRAINIEAFDDWAAEVAGEEEATLGLATMFVPMTRVERVFLDEQIGTVESYRQRFSRRVGADPVVYLGLQESE